MNVCSDITERSANQENTVLLVVVVRIGAGVCAIGAAVTRVGRHVELHRPEPVAVAPPVHLDAVREPVFGDPVGGEQSVVEPVFVGIGEACRVGRRDVDLDGSGNSGRHRREVRLLYIVTIQTKGAARGCSRNVTVSLNQPVEPVLVAGREVGATAVKVPGSILRSHHRKLVAVLDSLVVRRVADIPARIGVFTNG